MAAAARSSVTLDVPHRVPADDRVARPDDLQARRRRQLAGAVAGASRSAAAERADERGGQRHDHDLDRAVAADQPPGDLGGRVGSEDPQDRPGAIPRPEPAGQRRAYAPSAAVSPPGRCSPATTARRRRPIGPGRGDQGGRPVLSQSGGRSGVSRPPTSRVRSGAASTTARVVASHAAMTQPGRRPMVRPRISQDMSDRPIAGPRGWESNGDRDPTFMARRLARRPRLPSPRRRTTCPPDAAGISGSAPVRHRPGGRGPVPGVAARWR